MPGPDEMTKHYYPSKECLAIVNKFPPGSGPALRAQNPRHPAPFAESEDQRRLPKSCDYGGPRLDAEDLSRHNEDLRNARAYIRWGVASPGEGHPWDRLTEAIPTRPRPQDASPPSSRRPVPLEPLSPSKSQLGAPHPQYTASPDAGQGFRIISRGIPGGSQPRWSFENMPSLLQQPLGRDRGVARSVNGLPPAMMRQRSITRISSTSSSPSSQNDGRHRLGHDGGASRRTASEPLGARGFQGMHGMIGDSWGGAATFAGDAYRGGDGTAIGF